MSTSFDVSDIKIETQRLVLRPFTEADTADFYAYASVPGVGEMAGWPHHKSVEVSEAILKELMASKEVFAIYHKSDGKVIGSLGVHSGGRWTDRDERYKHLNIKEIGYVLSKDYWGLGLVPEAAKAVIDYGFTALELDGFSCAHFVENPQSKRVIEKCGFKFVKESVYYSQQLDRNFDSLKYILLRGDVK